VVPETSCSKYISRVPMQARFPLQPCQAPALLWHAHRQHSLSASRCLSLDDDRGIKYTGGSSCPCSPGSRGGGAGSPSPRSPPRALCCRGRAEPPSASTSHGVFTRSKVCQHGVTGLPAAGGYMHRPRVGPHARSLERPSEFYHGSQAKMIDARLLPWSCCQLEEYHIWGQRRRIFLFFFSQNDLSPAV